MTYLPGINIFFGQVWKWMPPSKFVVFDPYNLCRMKIIKFIDLTFLTYLDLDPHFLYWYI